MLVRVVARWVLNALALMVLPQLIREIRVDDFTTALVAAAVLAIINLLVRPLVLVLTLPFNLITLGLFTFVVNALMLKLAAAFVRGFEVPGFLPALVGSLVLTVLSMVVSSVLERK